MGAYLASPKTEKETEVFNDDFYRVGSSSMQGWRQNQEDAHKVILGFGALKDEFINKKLSDTKEDDPMFGVLKSSQNLIPSQSGLFSVFDGHGGPDVSKYAGTRVFEAYASLPVSQKSSDEEIQQVILNLDADIRQHFTEKANQAADTDDNSNSVQEMLEKELEGAKETGMTREMATELMMKVLYLQQHKPKSQNQSDVQGCTCVTSLIIPHEDPQTKERKFLVKATNSGDSRVLVFNQKTGQVHGTKDHKPNDPQEKKRIEHAGGEVKECPAGGNRVQYRVNGNLNLCRALGDYEYKKRDDLPPQEQMITSCPDVYTWECSEGDICVLACDGIFDVLNNEEVIKFVRDRICKMDLGTICEEIMMHCLADDPKTTHGLGGDNMTIMVIHLTGQHTKGLPPNVFTPPPQPMDEDN